MDNHDVASDRSIIMGWLRVLGLVAVTFLSMFVVKSLFFLNTEKFSAENREVKTTKLPSSAPALVVPVVVIRNTMGGSRHQLKPPGPYEKPIERVIQFEISDYEAKCSSALGAMSKMLEQALVSEHTSIVGGIAVAQRVPKVFRLSTTLQLRISRMATCLEHNQHVVRQLLGDLPYRMALPDRPSKGVVFEKKQNHQSIPLEGITPLSITASPDQSELKYHSYDSAYQVVAHLVRDWTTNGRSVRDSLYDWCCQKVEQYAFPELGARILVPGAGMGRLAYDLYIRGHHVEANEVSPSMTAAAFAILQKNVSGHLYPFILDAMANEVESSRRYDRVQFPDASLATRSQSLGTLSYTVCDFVGSDGHWYYRDHRKGTFDAVVTCFFIDTAHNIYEFLGTIDSVLHNRNGIWINVGPLQWHQNAILRPSVDELKDLLQSLGWTIVEWFIDEEVVSYRESKEDFVRMTNFEGYRPLRFVAIRSIT